MSKKHLVLGASGLVGSALMTYLINEEVTGTVNTGNSLGGKLKQLDITNYRQVMQLLEWSQPDVVYIACGLTNVDRCEDLPNITSATNVAAIMNLIDELPEDTKVVFFSSSYVFNGRAKDPYSIKDEPDPINEYGRQKHLIEMHLLGREKYLVVRTIGVFGKEKAGKNFADQVVRALTLGNEIHVPVDQIMNPINSYILAGKVVKLAESISGVVHVAGDKCISKYQFALDVAKLSGLDGKLIIGTLSEEMRQPAERPKNGCLYGEMVSYKEGLDRYANSLTK